jgi:hypothetical protein
MNSLDSLLKRNKDFAASQSAARELMPRAAVAVDVALLRAIPALPGDWLISGLVYDVATGLVEVVVPPVPKAAVAANRGFGHWRASTPGVPLPYHLLTFSPTCFRSLRPPVCTIGVAPESFLLA